MSDLLATGNCGLALLVCVIAELQSPNTVTVEDSFAFWFFAVLNVMYSAQTASQLYLSTQRGGDSQPRSREATPLLAPAPVMRGLTSRSAIEASYSTTLDMLLSSVSVALLRIYGHVEHPYTPAICAMLSVRVLDRVLVVLSGNVSLEKYSIPNLLQRLAAIYVDAIAVGILVQFGLTNSFFFRKNVSLYIFPLFYASLVAAKALRHLAL